MNEGYHRAIVGLAKHYGIGNRDSILDEQTSRDLLCSTANRLGLNIEGIDGMDNPSILMAMKIGVKTLHDADTSNEELKVAVSHVWT